MRPLLVAIALLAVPGAALAQAVEQQAPASFSCLGAERLEDDVFVVSFARASATLEEQARAALVAAAALAEAEPARNICILGHTGPEGGATTTTRLAARRAGAVADALAARGVARERMRAEARVAHFGRQRPNARPGALVTIVVMPAG